MNPWKVLLILIRYRPWYLALNLVGFILFFSAPLLMGFLLQEIVDTILGKGRGIWSVNQLLAAFGGWGVLNIGLIAWVTWAWFGLELSLCGLMRRNLLEWLMTGPGTRQLPDTSGESLSRLRDDVREVTLYYEMYVDGVGLAVFAVIAIYAMASINAPLTALILLPMFGVVVLVNRMSFTIRRLRRARREATGRVTSFIGETFSSVQAIKAACAEESISNAFSRLNEIRRKAAVKDQILSEVLMSMNQLMFSVTLGLLLCGVGTGIRDGSFTVGNLVLFITFLPRISHAISLLGRLLAQHRRTGVSVDRMESLAVGAPPGHIFRRAPLHLDGNFPEVPTLGSEPSEAFHDLEIRELSYHYPSSGRGVDHASFVVKKGQMVAITGRIASGKSTLLRSLLGLLPRDSGELLWNGKKIEDPASFLIPPRCAYTPQVPWLFSDQLRYNILLGNESHPQQLEQAVRMSVLEPDIEHLEDGLDTMVGPRGVKLSGGQVQRSSAARMFVREPSVLIMDDLSSALDVETEQALWSQLRNDQRTCLYVTHRKTALTMADQIIVLNDGRVDDIGDLETLLDRCAEMKALWREERE